MEERMHLPQGALSLAWVLADGEEAPEEASEEAKQEEGSEKAKQEASEKEGDFKFRTDL